MSTDTPGVQFWLEGCEEGLVASGRPKITLVIAATCDDDTQLEKVKKQFSDGFTVPTIEDFKGHMIKVLREDNKTYAQRIAELEAQLLAAKKELAEVRATYSFFVRR